LYRAARAAFRESVDETSWRPAPRSRAAEDLKNLAAREPALPAGAVHKIVRLLYFFLFAASEHLGALAALYRTHEVLIPPATLVRSAIEHSAVATWVLQRGEGPVDDRLARAYLEELMSAEEAKKAAGRLLGKEHTEHQSQKAHFKGLREEAELVFGQEPFDERGVATIRGQQRLGPTETVAAMLTTMGQPLADEVAVGTYDYLSNLSHPTLYPHAQMWTVADTASGRRVESSVTVADHGKQAQIAVVPYYETLAYVTQYNGWPSGPYDRLTAAMYRLLPGVFTDSVKL
jgi:hypothetical protein